MREKEHVNCRSAILCPDAIHKLEAIEVEGRPVEPKTTPPMIPAIGSGLGFRVDASHTEIRDGKEILVITAGEVIETGVYCLGSADRFHQIEEEHDNA